MVAKIGRVDSLYGVLAHNNKKVSEDTTRVIAANRMISTAGVLGENAMQQMMLSFESYLLANRNAEKPILHISLNPLPSILVIAPSPMALVFVSYGFDYVIITAEC